MDRPLCETCVHGQYIYEVGPYIRYGEHCKFVIAGGPDTVYCELCDPKAEIYDHAKFGCRDYEARKEM